MKDDRLRYLFNKYCYITILFILLHQVIVASSVIFISKSIALVNTNIKGSLVYLSLFCASLLLVYIPYFFNRYYCEKWKYQSYKNFIHAFIFKNKGDEKLQSDYYKTKYQTILSSESRVAFYDIIESQYNFLSTLFNSVFSIMAVIIAVNKELLIFYLLCIFSLIFIQFAARNTIGKKSRLIQIRKNITMKSIYSLWDAVVYNKGLAIWDKQFSMRHKRQVNDILKFEVYSFCINMTCSLISFLLIISGNFWFLYNSGFEVEKIGIVIATMPRQIQILQSSMLYLNSYFDLKSSLEKLNNIHTLTKLGNDKVEICISR